jgi:hypothetical protein
MLKYGYSRSEKEIQFLNNYFNDRMPEFNFEDLGFREKLWLYKAHLWLNLLNHDFLGAYKYSKKLVDLFYVNPQMINLNPVWYIKSSNYLLESLYLLKYKSLFKVTLENFRQNINHENFPKNDNLSCLSFLCVYNNRFSLHFLEGSFFESGNLISDTLKGISIYHDQLDEHHIMVFYYKIASLFFGMGQNIDCILYLNKIISNKNLSMREDLMCFARILNLVAHYEAGKDDNLEELVKDTYRFLIKMDDLHEVQKEFIKFLRNLGNIFPNQLKDEFRKLHKRLLQYENHPYEKRAFLYLDIISWLESKIYDKPVAEIIKEKAKTLIR